MKLSPGERSILAYFPSSNLAEEAMSALKEAGIEETQMDRVSRYGVSLNREINNPIAGQADTLTGLTLFSGDHDQYADNDARILMSADPSVYSMADGGYGQPEGKSFLVTVVTDDKNVDKAVEILKEKGAYI